MFFASATIENEKGEQRKIAICSLPQDENTDVPNGYERVYMERPIADKIMEATAQDKIPTSFECNGVGYTLLRYKAKGVEQIYNSYRDNRPLAPVHVRKARDIFVYLNRCRCERCFAQWGYDSLIRVLGYVHLKNADKTANINLFQCTRCNKLFIDKTSLEEYEKIYGELDITKRKVHESSDYETYRNYSEDSVLSRAGYTTSKGRAERRRILVRLLERGTPAAEIINHLTFLVHDRGWRYQNADAIWREDILFVNQYKLDEQTPVCVE